MAFLNRIGTWTGGLPPWQLDYSSSQRWSTSPSDLIRLCADEREGLALFLSRFASSSPDGLDKTAEALGFAESAKTMVHAPMPEYRIGPISIDSVSTSVAGAVGTVVVFGLAWMRARVLVRPAARQ